MLDRRVLVLGDVSDTLAALSAADAQSAQTLTGEQKTLDSLDAITPDPYTNFAAGMLRGWFRAFGTTGAYQNIAAPDGPGTIGLPPTDQEWAQFDATANQLGVGGFVAAAIKHMESSGNTLDKVTKAVTVATAQLDHFVPGWTVVIDLLSPALPFLPLLASGLAAASGLTADAAAGAIQATLDTIKAADQFAGGSVIPIDGLDSLAYSSQSAISEAATYVARVGASDATALAPLQATLVREAEIVATTRGGAIAQLEAAVVEAASEVIFALEIASSEAGPEVGLALSALALAMKATLAGALANGDATAKLEAAGWVLAKGAPALLASFGASTVAAIPDVSSTTVEIGPLTTNLGTLVKGIATIEASAASTAVVLGQAAVTAQALEAAAAKSRAATIAKANALDAQIAQLEQELAEIEAQLGAQKTQAAGLAGSGAVSPLLVLVLVALGAAVVREVTE